LTNASLNPSVKNEQFSHKHQSRTADHNTFFRIIPTPSAPTLSDKHLPAVHQWAHHPPAAGITLAAQHDGWFYQEVLPSYYLVSRFSGFGSLASSFGLRRRVCELPLCFTSQKQKARHKKYRLQKVEPSSRQKILKKASC
jgi:hypothetical protein